LNEGWGAVELCFECGNRAQALKISPLETPARKVVQFSDAEENDDGLKLTPDFQEQEYCKNVSTHPRP
jgi:hypothetical protein